MQEALLVGLVVALVWFVEKMLGTPMANRPLIISPLVGLVLGDLQSGIIIGASLELVFMGAYPSWCGGTTRCAHWFCTWYSLRNLIRSRI